MCVVILSMGNHSCLIQKSAPPEATHSSSHYDKPTDKGLAVTLCDKGDQEMQIRKNISNCDKHSGKIQTRLQH